MNSSDMQNKGGIGMTKFAKMLAVVCILFLMGEFAQPALAEDTEPAVTYVAQIGSTKYTTLQDAINHAGDRSTISLLCDIQLSETITLDYSGTSLPLTEVDIDMNGHNITGDCTLFSIGSKTYIVFLNPLQTGGTIKSTSINQSTIVVSGNMAGVDMCDVNIVSINAVGVELSNNAVGGMRYGTIEGGTYGVSCTNNSRFYFEGGTVHGETEYCIKDDSSTIEIHSNNCRVEISEDKKTEFVGGDAEVTIEGRSLLFGDLQGALDYAEGYYGYGNTYAMIRLLNDVELTSTATNATQSNIMIDLNGYQITGSGTLIQNNSEWGTVIKNSASQSVSITTTSTDVPAIKNCGVLYLDNINLSGGSECIEMQKKWYCDVALTVNNSTVKCNNGIGVNCKYGTVNIVSGTISGVPYAFCDAVGALWTGYTLGEKSGYISNTDTTVTVGIKHTLAVTAGTGGSITTESGGDYVKGAEINLSASPDDGYYFSGWTSSGGGTFENAGSASTAFTMPAGSVTVAAHFALISNDDSDITYYTISALVGTGGNISPSGSVSVAYGGSKTYSITADDEYEIKDVLVDGVSVGAVGSYTFENVKKAHIITASFAEKKVVNPFTDVENSDWFYDNVLYVYKNGLMNGTASDTFSPNGGMTRSMFVTVLYRLSGDTGSYSGNFTDVPSGEWYESAVAWAAKNGIARGVGDNRFTPNTGITREQLAVIFYHYANYKGYDVSVGEGTNILSYKDALSISEYAYSALQWACGAGIINGNNEYLNPNGPVTRAEVAAILQRFVENVAS